MKLYEQFIIIFPEVQAIISVSVFKGNSTLKGISSEATDYKFKGRKKGKITK